MLGWGSCARQPDSGHQRNDVGVALQREARFSEVLACGSLPVDRSVGRDVPSGEIALYGIDRQVGPAWRLDEVVAGVAKHTGEPDGSDGAVHRGKYTVIRRVGKS